MTAVAINRLRLRGPPDRAARAAFLIEDACRTGLPTTERLVLIRRLELGRGLAAEGPAGRGAAMGRAYGRATGDARHGGEDGAADANCVWFASRAEARRLLLLTLLAGRRPAGWFWALAVPDWRGRPLAEWLGERLAAPAADEEEEGETLDLVLLAAAGGGAEAVLEALARSAGAAAATRPGGPRPADAPAPAAAHPGETPAAAAIAEARSALEGLRAALPPPFLLAVESIVRAAGPHGRPAARLLERLLVRASPALSLSGALLDRLVRAYALWLASPDPSPPAAARPEPAGRKVAGRQGSPPGRAPSPLRPDPGDRPAAAPAAQAAPRDGAASRPTAEPAREPPVLDAADRLAEAATPAAGLWLAIPSLIRLGLREWLAQRPALLAADAGRVLLRAIADRHRLPPDDPALAPLALAGDGFEPPDWARLWTTGLDRWLRRRAGVKLAGLVWRAGWVRLSGDRLVLRFPEAAADIRLRRRALDVDPGWTDWLGLSVRYAFSDRPL